MLKLGTVQEAARNKLLEGLYLQWDRYFQRVGCWLRHSEDPLDVSLGRTDSSIWSLATVFSQETWTSTWNKPQGQFERLQSQSQLHAASNHHSASHSLLRNQRAQSPSRHPESGEQRCHLQSPPFRCWSVCPHRLPVVCKARSHATPKLPWWNASWRNAQSLQNITRQYTRHNAPRGNIQRHTVVYQGKEL